MGGAQTVFHYASHHSIMERPDDVENPQWTAKLEEYGPQALTTDPGEGLGQVHKENAQVLILLAALFLDLSYGEYHVDFVSVSSEGTLTLRDDIIQEVVCDTVQYDTRQDLSWNIQQRDASVVVTGCSVIFVLVQKVDDVGVLEVLRH